jgi:hypothetical protein
MGGVHNPLLKQQRSGLKKRGPLTAMRLLHLLPRRNTNCAPQLPLLASLPLPLSPPPPIASSPLPRAPALPLCARFHMPHFYPMPCCPVLLHTCKGVRRVLGARVSLRRRDLPRRRADVRSVGSTEERMYECASRSCNCVTPFISHITHTFSTIHTYQVLRRMRAVVLPHQRVCIRAVLRRESYLRRQ